MTRVLVACDHQIVRSALRSLLESHGDVEVVGEASAGSEALDRVVKLQPDVVLLEVSLPRLPAARVTRDILDSDCGAKVLALCIRENSLQLADARRAGASGFLGVGSEPGELFTAIASLEREVPYVSPAVADVLGDPLAEAEPRASLQKLTQRERQVLRMVADGLSTREIAGRLGVSAKTADAHRSNLMAKLGVHKVTGLVRFAIREGLVAP